MDGPNRPYVHRYISIFAKISDHKTEHFNIRELRAPATCFGAAPLLPTTPPNDWSNRELIWSAVSLKTMLF